MDLTFNLTLSVNYYLIFKRVFLYIINFSDILKIETTTIVYSKLDVTQLVKFLIAIFFIQFIVSFIFYSYEKIFVFWILN